MFAPVTFTMQVWCSHSDDAPAVVADAVAVSLDDAAIQAGRLIPAGSHPRCWVTATPNTTDSDGVVGPHGNDCWLATIRDDGSLTVWAPTTRRQELA